MKAWELRAEQATVICVSVGMRRERRESLAGEMGGEQRRKSPSGNDERRKPTVFSGQGTGWKSRLEISRQIIFSLNHTLKK